jgi:hypothetical protein
MLEEQEISSSDLFGMKRHSSGDGNDDVPMRPSENDVTSLPSPWWDRQHLRPGTCVGQVHR